jgi:tetratricopeptide (TPR) repeat protein
LPGQAVETRGATKSTEARNLFEEAKLKTNSGDFIGAERDLTRALSLDANYGQAYANRSAARFNIADYRGAIEDADKALKYLPDLKPLQDIKARAVTAMANQAHSQQNQPSAQAQDMAQRQALARQMLLQAQLGGDFSDPSTMIMMQAQRIAAARAAQNAGQNAIPNAIRAQAQINNSGGATVAGKNNPFSGHADGGGPFSGQSTGTSPFAEQSSGNSPFAANENNNPFAAASNSSPVTTTEGNNAFAAASSVGQATPADRSAQDGAPSGLSAKEYFQKGCEKNKAQDFVNAIDFFNHAIDLDQTNGDAYANRGLARFHIMDFKGALKDFEDADRLIPNNKELKHYIEICKQVAK